ncbi:MAG TPA: cysteine desulfurase family protein [Propionicimonas sp.]|nr:cysteine desulfurase family protein [Propionicimonas sp.]
MRHYLDHAATAPLRPAAARALADALGQVGNPSSLHASGRAARRLLAEARESVAADLGAAPPEVVFTSGGTEADNLALLGAAGEDGRLLVSAIEHPAVAGVRQRLPGRVDVLGVGADGYLDPAALAGSLVPGTAAGRGTALVSVMWVNNETGAVQPVAELARRCTAAGVLFHTDAVQAVGHLGVAFGEVGADLLSVSAHKVGGPVGIGALLVRRGVALRPPGFGGGQEAGLRSGTVGVALAAGFAAALHEAVAELPTETTRLEGLRRVLLAGLLAVPGVEASVAGPVSPAIAHVVVAGARADDVLLLLDAAGIDCSTGSACTAGVHQPSEVLLAMGRDAAAASAALRFSFGPGSGPDAVAAVLAAFPEAVRRARLAA